MQLQCCLHNVCVASLSPVFCHCHQCPQKAGGSRRCGAQRSGQPQPFSNGLSAAIISLINKTWLADTDLLERAKGAVAPSLVPPSAACVLLIMWHSGGCLVIHDEAAATLRMCHRSQGGFFSPVLIIWIYKGGKKKYLEYEEDEGGKNTIKSDFLSLASL